MGDARTSRGRVARLRGWLVACAVVLLLVIAGFLGYARFRTHRFLTGLPGKLGVDIRQETNGFTYSQSVQGKTVFTIHAARAVQRKNGKVTLHDVGIVLYGRKQDRADRIYGSEFEYDQAAGVVKAMGEVHLDLSAPAPPQGRRGHAPSAADEAVKEPGADPRVVHVKTSGLVFLQKLGVAATDQPIEFESGGITGRATGAEYSSDTGVVVLHSAVQVSRVGRDGPVMLTASRAELDRASSEETQKLTLTDAKYVAVGLEGVAAQTMEARQAVVRLGKDGAPERVEAEGQVTLSGGGRGRLTAARADVDLNAAGQARAARFYGGLKYLREEAGRQTSGEAGEARVAFNAGGKAERVVLVGQGGDGQVHGWERLASAAGATTRELWSRTVDMALGEGPRGKTLLRSARADGAARLTLVTLPVATGAANGVAGKKDAGRSDMLAADALEARFEALQGRVRVSGVHGTGHTLLRQLRADGSEETSRGDLLEASFTGQGSKAGTVGQTNIAQAVQSGHVSMTRVAPAVVGAGGVAGTPERRDQAHAEKAVYEGAEDRLTLTGAGETVEVESAGSVLRAATVMLLRSSGDATASGRVSVTYAQPGQTEPVHVLAERAELQQKTGRAQFFAAHGGVARMWQGASQLEAAVVELDRTANTLRAHGEGAGAAGAVRTVMMGMRAGTGKSAGTGGASAMRGQVVRIASREMTYSDSNRQASFTGGVKLEDADGSMRADQALAVLQSAGVKGGPGAGVAGGSGSGGGASNATPPAGKSAMGFAGGSVERVTATGSVEVTQPGRRATGERLVYTASDGVFVLTGSPGVGPKVEDEARGTVTGASLRFKAGDDSVVVSGQGGGTTEHTRTETRVRQQ